MGVTSNYTSKLGGSSAEQTIIPTVGAAGGQAQRLRKQTVRGLTIFNEHSGAITVKLFHNDGTSQTQFYEKSVSSKETIFLSSEQLNIPLLASDYIQASQSTTDDPGINIVANVIR